MGWATESSDDETTPRAGGSSTPHAGGSSAPGVEDGSAPRARERGPTVPAETVPPFPDGYGPVYGQSYRYEWKGRQMERIYRLFTLDGDTVFDKGTGKHGVNAADGVGSKPDSDPEDMFTLLDPKHFEPAEERRLLQKNKSRNRHVRVCKFRQVDAPKGAPEGEFRYKWRFAKVKEINKLNKK